MSNQENYSIGASEGRADEFTGGADYVETMRLRSITDQKLAESKDKLKASSQRLANFLENPLTPDNLILRELSILTQRIGSHHSALLDSASP
jgi:hypothetical protein